MNESGETKKSPLFFYSLVTYPDLCSINTK